MRPAPSHHVRLGEHAHQGGIFLGSIYPKDSEGLSDTYRNLLEAVATTLGTLKGPWVIGGDWNLAPAVLAASNWLNIVDGVIFATEQPTCGDNVYDYFVVHKSLAHAVAGVQRIEDGGLRPHWPTRLLMRGDAKRFAVRRLIRAPRVDGRLPHGSEQQAPDYGRTTELAADGKLDDATVEWYKSARGEWSHITGEDLSFRPATFRWTSAVTMRASATPGSTTLSAAWRANARRAQDLLRILAKPQVQPADWKLVAQHLLGAKRAAKPFCNGLAAQWAAIHASQHTVLRSDDRHSSN